MSCETIKFRTEEGYCVITLNRPDALNAISALMWRELDGAIDEWLNTDHAGALIITGAPRRDGRPCFCAGVDLKQSEGEVRAGDPSLQKKATPSAALWNQRRPRLPMSSTLVNLAWAPKISIAAIDGVCTAGGVELALCCDIILAAETAQISDMHAKNLGWIGGGGAATSMACRAAQDMDRMSSWLYSDTAFQTLFDEPDAGDWGPRRWLKGR